MGRYETILHFFRVKEVLSYIFSLMIKTKSRGSVKTSSPTQAFKNSLPAADLAPVVVDSFRFSCTTTKYFHDSRPPTSRHSCHFSDLKITLKFLYVAYKKCLTSSANTPILLLVPADRDEEIVALKATFRLQLVCNCAEELLLGSSVSALLKYVNENQLVCPRISKVEVFENHFLRVVL